MSQFNFDATKVAPQGDRSPLPPGKYPVILSSSELKAVKPPGVGQFINLGMKVLDGPMKDKMMFTNLNVVNPNPVAQQIGQERLSALCHVVGVLQITDTAQLHGRPFMVDVTVDKDGKYNEVSAFLRADGTGAVAANGAASAPTGAPPWASGAPAVPPAAPPPMAPPPAMPPPAPMPPVTPPPAAVPAPMFYVANLQGQNLTPAPVSADQIRVMPQGLAQLQICPVGGNAWQPAASLAVSAPAQGATAGPGVPPWLQTPPPA